MPYFITLLLMFIPLTASAEIYTWKDANGVTHFAQEKPSDQEAQSVEVEEQKIPTQPTAEPTTENVEGEEPAAMQSTPETTTAIPEPEQSSQVSMGEENSVAEFIEKNDAIKPNEGTATIQAVETTQPEQKSAAQYIEANKASKPAEGKALEE